MNVLITFSISRIPNLMSEDVHKYHRQNQCEQVQQLSKLGKSTAEALRPLITAVRQLLHDSSGLMWTQNGYHLNHNTAMAEFANTKNPRLTAIEHTLSAVLGTLNKQAPLAPLPVQPLVATTPVAAPPTNPADSHTLLYSVNLQPHVPAVSTVPEVYPRFRISFGKVLNKLCINSK